MRMTPNWDIFETNGKIIRKIPINKNKKKIKKKEREKEKKKIITNKGA